MPGLTIGPDQGGVCPVWDEQGRQVGNLKRIGGRWKFKAIGYGPHDQVVPGGGPLTERHNMTFAQLDESEIRAQFFGR